MKASDGGRLADLLRGSASPASISPSGKPPSPGMSRPAIPGVVECVDVHPECARGTPRPRERSRTDLARRCRCRGTRRDGVVELVDLAERKLDRACKINLDHGLNCEGEIGLARSLEDLDEGR